MRPEDEYRLRKVPSAFDETAATPPTDVSDRQRSGCLTLWMITNIGAAIIGIFVLLPYSNLLTRRFSIVFTLLLFSLLATQGVAAYFILQWKRKAVYIFAASLFVSFVLKTTMRLLQMSDFVSLGLGLALLAVFIRPQWNAYEG